MRFVSFFLSLTKCRNRAPADNISIFREKKLVKKKQTLENSSEEHSRVHTHIFLQFTNFIFLFGSQIKSEILIQLDSSCCGSVMKVLVCAYVLK